MKEKRLSYELNETRFSDKWSTFKFLTEIQSDLKKDITSDFILAKLNEVQKESVIELVRDAYFIKKEIEKYCGSTIFKVGANGKYLRNADKTYKRFPLTQEEQEYIKNIAKMTFNSIMIKILMTKIEYRNVDKNVIIELITEKDKMSAENQELREENEELTKRMKNNIKEGANKE